MKIACAPPGLVRAKLQTPGANKKKNYLKFLTLVSNEMIGIYHISIGLSYI